MTNTNIQGPVPLSGRGMVTHINGDFQSGEFRNLVNAEILDEKIVSRRPIYTKQLDTVADGAVTGGDQKRWIYRGHLGNTAIYVNSVTGAQRALTPNLTGAIPAIDSTALFNASDIISLADVAYGNIAYVFNYNNKNYWLVIEHPEWQTVGDPVTTAQGFAPFGTIFSVVGLDEAAPLTDAGFALDNWPYINASILDDYSLANGFAIKYDDSTDPGTALFRNAFMFKDRLWITLDSTIRFSKATDPQTWAVPDGGFFNFPDDKINYAVGLRDTIYVFCETRIYTITYSTDPNTDPAIRVLTDQLGGSHAIVHQDTVYFFNSEGIFVVSNNTYVSQVVASSEIGSPKDARLATFGKYLIINKTDKPSVDLTSYVTRWNKIRNGFIHSSTTISQLVTAATAGVVLTNDAGGGSVGFGLANTNSVKATHDATANAVIGWSTTPGSAGARHIKVIDGESYLCSVYLKSNLAGPTTSISVQIKLAAYTEADVLINEDYFFDTLTLAEGWKQFKFVSQIGNNVAAGTPSYVKMVFTLTKKVGGVTTNYGAGEAVYSNLYVVEPFKSNTPFLFAANNMETAKLYDVGFITGLGAQKVHYNPIPAAGITNAVANAYRRSADLNGLGAQTLFFNTENKSIHAVSLPGKDTSTAISSDVVEEISPFSYQSDKYTGPLLMFNASNVSGGSQYWLPSVMFENKELLVDKFSYRDVIISTAGAQTFYRPLLNLEVSAFAPDGLAYMLKKFRSMELQGKLPKDGSILFEYYPENALNPVQTITLKDDLVAGLTARPHYGHRVGILCRGKVITLRLYIDTALAQITGGPVSTDLWEISDLRLLWNYVGRGPLVKSVTS